ncbi:hypothetical protein GUJ93_ZPchr0001g33215 [Zizania palustris]|uniref:BHLH domain-containing protein n=1 Tax=Zizania palustris TaxID=103762 RepID=A0A8J5V6A2_ZIZPA|nr:hypothetical protein GUJ93_ZPchr0001g33215 [Zizania palustris]KAG8051991.1 hypothetical protein GUJ93_ZPchr0001g33215 [Zizania palustris]
MYHPQCELLMPHETLDLDVGQSHLGVATMPGEINFHLLHSLDAAANGAASSAAGAASSQPTVDYFFGGTDQLSVQFEQLSAPHHQTAVAMQLRDYYGHYPATEAYLRGPRTGSSIVFGSPDDESAYMVGPFESSPTPRSGGGRKRNRASAGFHGGPVNGVEKKEKQRRQKLTAKFNALMLLIPNRTKEDRATVISDAIEYIQELGRTVEELTLLVEKKRRRRELQGDVVDAAPSAVLPAMEVESSEGEVAAAAVVPRQPIRSTFIKRRSKETSVDVRIVEDEVNIKLTKRRRDGCLAAASRALDDLRLDLIHLSGGKIGDCHIYMFNTKVTIKSQHNQLNPSLIIINPKSNSPTLTHAI